MLRPRAFSSSVRGTAASQPAGAVRPSVAAVVASKPASLELARAFEGGAAIAAARGQQQQQQQQQTQRARVVAQAKKDKKEKDAPSASSSASSSGNDDLDRIGREVQKDAEERMQKAINVVMENFNTMRTGRANPAILDKIIVDYYGAPTPLKTLASIAVPDASTLIVAPFDRAALRDVEKAILESDIGINPSNDGEKIRLNIPAMTQERRKELVKKVAKMGEDGKVAVRNVRKDALKRLDRHDFAKDARKGLDDAVQKLTDRFVKSVDDLAKAKSDELMKV